MKGVLFSLIMFFISIFLAIFLLTQRASIGFYSTQKAIENRVDGMLSLIKNVFDDSERAIEIIGRRACVAAINYVITNGIPLSAANETIAELMLNGSINSVNQSLMEHATIRDWSDTLEYLIETQGFKAKIEILNLTISPLDSFNLEIDYSIKVELSDLKTKTNITKSKRKSISLSIEYLEDPLYPLNTYGRVINVIVKSPHWMNYSSEDTGNLQDDLINSYYHPSLYGASFLDRLEGKYFVQEKYRRENPIGLESFVNKDKILVAGLPVNYYQTNVDYLYFSNANVTSHKVVGMPDSFRLDNETTINGMTHLQIYNVTVES